MNKRTPAVAYAMVVLLALPMSASSQEEHSLNEANNTLTPKVTINLQNFYIPEFVDVPEGEHANQFLLRGLVPADTFGLPQLIRFTLPVATSPQAEGGYVTGIGGLTLIDLFILRKSGDVNFAAGPLLVIPTANEDELGSGKWQAGAAGVAGAPQSWGLLGGLATYQASFAGSDLRDDVNLFTFQPIVNVNLDKGFYLRSTATWNFNLEAGASYVPVGLGVGKVFQLEKGITMNAFIEPQYTVWHEGRGAPRWQVFAGVNFQFPIGH